MEKYNERRESIQVDVRELEHFLLGPENAGISVMSLTHLEAEEEEAEDWKGLTQHALLERQVTSRGTSKDLKEEVSSGKKKETDFCKR